MIENALSKPGVSSLLGIVSICLFFLVFGGAVVWALVQPRDRMRRMGNLPLNEDIESENSTASAAQKP